MLVTPLGEYVGFAFLAVSTVLGIVLRHHPTASLPDLGARQASLAALHEAARSLGHQVNVLLPSFQLLPTLTLPPAATSTSQPPSPAPAKPGANSCSREERQLQHNSFQLMSQGRGALRATFAALPALQEATSIQEQRFNALAPTLQTLKTLMAQLPVQADASGPRQSQLHNRLQQRSELPTKLRILLTTMLEEQGATVNQIDQLQQELAVTQQTFVELRRNDEGAGRQQEGLADLLTPYDTLHH